VYVSLQASTPAGFELGSHGKSRAIEVVIYGENDAQRVRLAETIENIIRGVVPIYSFITGNETSPTIDDYFVTDDVGWEKIPSLSITPQKQRWRSSVSATVRRVVDA
jgi:hypothetical protein